MSLEQFLDKLREIEGIMSSQDSPMETSVSDNQEKDSGVKADQLMERNASLWKEIAPPIEGIIPVSVTSWEMGLGLTSGHNIQVKNIGNLLLHKSLLQCVQGTSSVEQWELYFKNNTTYENTFPVYWHKTKVLTRWDNTASVTKLGMKKEPLKHKNLLQKPKLLCIQGNPKAKTLEWVKGIERIKEENSNLLRKSKLYCHQGKSNANSSEWINSIINIQGGNTNWARTSDISLGLEALMIESKDFKDSDNAYDMQALTEECENLKQEKPIIKYYLMRDFKALIKECEKREEEARRVNYGSRYQNPNEVNPNELAGYLNNSLHIPREMSVMAKSMYT